MAEETVTTVVEDNKPVTDAATNTGDATGPNSDSGKTFTQADLDRIINERLQQERSKGEKAAAKAKSDAETAALAEQGKYKEIADQATAKLAAAEQAAKAAEMRLLQRDVAAKTSLPLPLAERLRGETLEEMEADAKAIMAALPKPAAPNINPSNGTGGAPAPGALDDAEKKRIADKYGVDSRYGGRMRHLTE